MTQILFPFDFSAQGVQVAPYVRALAGQLGAGVTILSVVPLNRAVMPDGMDDDVASWTRALQVRLDQALVGEFAGVPVTRMTGAGDPAQCITETALDKGVDLIMMPTHGLGLFRTLLVGSTTSKVLHDAVCPVWTAVHAEQQQAGQLPRKILCAVEGRPEGAALLRWAAEFSGRVGAALTLLHVIDPLTEASSLDRSLQDKVREAAFAEITAIQTAFGVRAPLRVVFGDVATRVTACAVEEEADLIVIGRGSIPAPLGRLRTHAYGIVQRSPCPVVNV